MSVVIIVLLLLWIVPPIFIAPLVAAERDRSALGGFLLGLGLGWVGVGVVLLLGPNPQARSRQTQAPYDSEWGDLPKKCPSCGFEGHITLAGVPTCGDCGKPLVPDLAPPAVTPAAEALSVTSPPSADKQVALAAELSEARIARLKAELAEAEVQARVSRLAGSEP